MDCITLTLVGNAIKAAGNIFFITNVLVSIEHLDNPRCSSMLCAGSGIGVNKLFTSGSSKMELFHMHKRWDQGFFLFHQLQPNPARCFTPMESLEMLSASQDCALSASQYKSGKRKGCFLHSLCFLSCSSFCLGNPPPSQS